MYDDGANVCHAAYDGRRTKYDWRQGRGGRKWQRWWRRWIAGQVSHRRVLQHVERYYGEGGKQGYQGVTWHVWRLDDPEVRQHLLVVRLGGEGRFGKQTPTHTSWDQLSQQPYVVPADGTGPSFHVLVVGTWRRHGTVRGRMDESDIVKRRRYKDPHDRWSQWQLRQLQDDDEQQEDPDHDT